MLEILFWWVFFFLSTQTRKEQPFVPTTIQKRVDYIQNQILLQGEGEELRLFFSPT